jgi:Lrp/AsnC family transcriptional regulator, regulator for asnA, asnC and gidA
VVTRKDKAVTRRNNERGVTPDDVSKAIIEELQQDGRRPYAAIARAVGLSEAAVRQRVQRLLDNDIMQIVAVTNPLEVGFPRQAMIGVTVEGPPEPVADALAHMPEIDYVVTTAGGFDVLAEIVCESDEHLHEVLSNRIRAIPGVLRTESFVYLRLRKQTYAWGVR